ncbi:MAG TPA: hypothetical protein DCZ71_08825 [Ruminococcus sp.]|nr:hypothetical protein [Ruminococcus sp.]
MFLFIKKPHIVKSRNKTVRAVMVFALAFVPGVLAASVCAGTITAAYNRFFNSDDVISAEELEEPAEEDEDEEGQRNE